MRLWQDSQTRSKIKRHRPGSGDRHSGRRIAGRIARLCIIAIAGTRFNISAARFTSACSAAHFAQAHGPGRLVGFLLIQTFSAGFFFYAVHLFHTSLHHMIIVKTTFAALPGIDRAPRTVHSGHNQPLTALTHPKLHKSGPCDRQLAFGDSYAFSRFKPLRYSGPLLPP
ncbi:MAG: hypothetical protein QG575_1592 [Euryarchaeota archaeon]|nr:hypothetical protein [Euryarchaeota archaeon]